MGFIADLARQSKDTRRSPTDRGEGRRLWQEIFGEPKEHEPRPAQHNRGTITNNPAATKRFLQALRSMAPGGWTDDRLEESRHYVGVPYIAIHRQNELLSMAEFQVFIKDRTNPEGKREVTPEDPPQGGRVVRPYDLVRLLENPNAEDSFGDWIAKMNLQLDLTGTALTWMVPNELGTPMELYPVETAIAVPQATYNDQFPHGCYRIQPLYPYGPFSSTPTPLSAAGTLLPAEWMMRVKYPHPLLRYEGYSPLTALRMHFDEIEMIDRSRHSSMRRGIIPSAVLNFEGVDGMDAMPEPEIERVRAEFEAALQGPDNAGNLFVSAPGSKLEQFGQRPVDMDFQAGWDQLVSFGLGGMGITKPAAGMIEDSSYSTLFATLKQLYWLTLDPKNNRVAQRITRRIAPFFGDDLIVEIRCKRIDDHEVLNGKVDKLVSLRGLPKSVIRLALRLLDLPVEEELVEEMSKSQEQQPGGMMGGAPAPSGEDAPEGQSADAGMETADEGMEPAQGKERMAEEEKKKVEASRPSPGTLSRGALGPRKSLNGRLHPAHR